MCETALSSSEHGQYWTQQPDTLTAGPAVIPRMILSGLQNGASVFHLSSGLPNFGSKSFDGCDDVQSNYGSKNADCKRHGWVVLSVSVLPYIPRKRSLRSKKEKDAFRRSLRAALECLMWTPRPSSLTYRLLNCLSDFMKLGVELLYRNVWIRCELSEIGARSQCHISVRIS
jgi:hypothetical protein